MYIQIEGYSCIANLYHAVTSVQFSRGFPDTLNHMPDEPIDLVHVGKCELLSELLHHPVNRHVGYGKYSL